MKSVLNKKIAGALVLTSLITLALGCNPQQGSTNSVGVGGNSLSFVGSLKQHAYVAKTKFEYLLSLAFPRAFASSSGLTDSQANVVTLNEAWISLQEIKVIADAHSNEGQAEDFVIHGPLAVNLLSEQPFAFDMSAISETGYNALSMKFHKTDVELDGAPLELIDNSIYLSGEVNGHTFSFLADDSAEFVLAGTNSLQPDNQQGLVVVFGLAKLISKIDLSGILTSTVISKDNKVEAVNACPEIDSSANDLFTCFEKGLKIEAEFGKHNGDYDLDDASDETVN